MNSLRSIQLITWGLSRMYPCQTSGNQSWWIVARPCWAYQQYTPAQGQGKGQCWG